MKLTDTQIYVLVATRLLFGALFFLSGMSKYLSGFSAQTYLLSATQGPFASMFQSLSGNAVVDFLVIFGEVGIGLALLSGLFLRFTAVCGILMMLLFYLSSFPPATGVINIHIMYSMLFLVLAELKSGEYLSIPSLWRQVRRGNV